MWKSGVFFRTEFRNPARISAAEFRMRNSARKTPPVYAEIRTEGAEFRCGIHTSCGFPHHWCGFPHRWCEKMSADFRIRGPYSSVRRASSALVDALLVSARQRLSSLVKLRQRSSAFVKLR